jgi:hypothetical protein
MVGEFYQQCEDEIKGHLELRAPLAVCLGAARSGDYYFGPGNGVPSRIKHSDSGGPPRHQVFDKGLL